MRRVCEEATEKEMSWKITLRLKIFFNRETESEAIMVIT
jgi:hypothetical protein